jgi:uncharacterized protein YjaG (DUF416 family)
MPITDHTHAIALNHHWQKIAFIAALCERHEPNFQLYCETQDQTDNSLLYRKFLNKVWEYLLEQLTSMRNLEKALLQFEEVVPEPCEDDGYGVYPALDACLLLISSLQMILDDSIDDVDISANLSAATVTHFLLFTGNADDENQTLNHPLLQEELAFQQRIISDLADDQISKLTRLKNIRSELNLNSVSNLGIEAS